MTIEQEKCRWGGGDMGFSLIGVVVIVMAGILASVVWLRLFGSPTISATHAWSWSTRRGASMYNNRAFTLIETLIALVIGVAVVLGIGGLGERLVHHRVTADSNSAAMSLAERQMEVLLADLNPDPTTAQCPAAKLCSGTHGPSNVDIDLAASTSGPYSVQWTVVDSTTTSTSPFVLATTGGAAQKAVKKITMTVSHLRNPYVNATVVRYYKVT